MGFAQGLDLFQIAVRRHVDPAFPLDRFQEDAAHIIIHGLFHGSQIPKGNVDEAFRQGVQAFMVMILASSCQGFHGPAMEGIFGCDDLEFLWILAVAVFPSQFDSPFIGFCPTITEEHPVEGSHLTQLFGRFGLDSIIEQVGTVHDLASLFAHSLHQRRIGIPQGVDRDARQEIRIFIPIRIIQIRSFSVVQSNGAPSKDREIIFLRGIHDFFCIHRASSFHWFLDSVSDNFRTHTLVGEDFLEDGVFLAPIDDMGLDGAPG